MPRNDNNDDHPGAEPPADLITTITCRPIGFIRSPFSDTAGMPIQTAGAPGEQAALEVLPEFGPGLRDVAGFEYLILVTHLHRAAHERLEVLPFLDDQSRGVFATRAPARPNRIGLSIVRLEALQGLRLLFSGNDMVDGTPVLDIKPYVPQFDARATEKIGWFSTRVQQVGGTKSDRRMD